MKTFSSILAFLFCVTVSYTQEKNEFEQKIKARDVPKQAKAWLKDAYESKRKTRWYLQTDDETEVYEAKLKHKSHLHSVEFDMDGEVKNIEVLIKEKEVKQSVLDAINSYFESNYDKFSISKLQIQYTGEPDDLEDVIDEDEFENINIQYEIEFYGKSDTDDEMWEGLFDEKGILIEKRVIILKATDNLDY